MYYHVNTHCLALHGLVCFETDSCYVAQAILEFFIFVLCVLGVLPAGLLCTTGGLPQAPKEARRGSSGIGVTDGCEPPCRC